MEDNNRMRINKIVCKLPKTEKPLQSLYLQGFQGQITFKMGLKSGPTWARTKDPQIMSLLL